MRVHQILAELRITIENSFNESARAAVFHSDLEPVYKQS
jgi:hypothetical protein